MIPIEPIEVRRYEGRGPTLLVLHGGPGAQGSAAGLASALAGKFVVLEPLQRRSGTLPLTVSQHVSDLRAVAPERALLVGWSWGAMLALSYAASFPERVAGLVLVSSGTYDEASRQLFRTTLASRLGPALRQQVAELKSRIGSETDPSVRDRIQAELGSIYMKAESYDLLEIGFENTLPPDTLGNAETWNDALRLQREGVEPAAFERISAPVLMVHGAFDPHPGQRTRDVLRSHIPELEYVEFERCGHEPWRERHARGRFLEVVGDFCEAIAKRAGS